MATTFYFRASGTSPHSPAFSAGWLETGYADRGELVTWRDTAKGIDKKFVDTKTLYYNVNCLNRQYNTWMLCELVHVFSGLINAQIEGGMVNPNSLPSGVLSGTGLYTGIMVPRLYIRLMTPSGTVRGLLYNNYTTESGWRYPNSGYNPSAVGYGNVNFSFNWTSGVVRNVTGYSGDYICAEIGVTSYGLGGKKGAVITGYQRFRSYSTIPLDTPSGYVIAKTGQPFLQFSDTFLMA